jgi:hypothetical protein
MDHEQTSVDDCSIEPQRVKHTTRISEADSEHLHIDFLGVLINRTTVTNTTLYKCNSSLFVNPITTKGAPIITLACRTYCPSSGAIVQSLLETKFPSKCFDD